MSRQGGSKRRKKLEKRGGCRVHELQGVGGGSRGFQGGVQRGSRGFWAEKQLNTKKPASGFCAGGSSRPNGSGPLSVLRAPRPFKVLGGGKGEVKPPKCPTRRPKSADIIIISIFSMFSILAVQEKAASEDLLMTHPISCMQEPVFDQAGKWSGHRVKTPDRDARVYTYIYIYDIYAL